MSQVKIQSELYGDIQKYRIKSLYDNKIGATKELIIQENQKTRDLIQANYIEGLRTALSDAKAEISNRDQSSYILNTMGRWHGYPSCGCGVGTCSTYAQNLIQHLSMPTTFFLYSGKW